MSLPFVQTLGKTKPYVANVNELSTITSNDRGLVFTLGHDGKIYFVDSLRKISNAAPSLLPLDYAQFSKEKFSAIQFSDDGNLLVAWSDTSVGIIDLKMFSRTGLVKNEMNSFRKVLPRNFEGDNNRIVRVRFHPYHSVTVVVLYATGRLVLVNTVSDEVTIIPLNIEYKFVSFSFGPQCDWLALSLFLLSEQGEIFVLCPVLPRGAEAPQEVIDQMYVSLEERRASMGPRSSPGSSKYFSVSKAFLMERLGGDAGPGAVPRSRADGIPSTILSPTITNLHRSGISGGSMAGDRLPLLQGPLKSSRTFRRPASDLCVPKFASSSGAVPAVLVAYLDGSVSSFLIGPQPSVSASQ